MIYDFFRWIAIITAYPVQLLFFKRKTYYEDKTEQTAKIKGGALIISNHFNVFDYMMNMFVVLPRKLHVVASEHAYKNPLIAFGMRFFGGIYANRVSRSMRFIDDSVEVIQKGKLVQIFPEGRNTDDGTIKPFKPSYLMIALRSGAPIIPIVTDGNYGFFKRAHIIIGKKICLSDYCQNPTPSREELIALNDMVYKKVLTLKETLEDLKKPAKNKLSKG